MKGRRLGPYRLESLLGRGGMGVVYSAWDDRLERRVALKRVAVDRNEPDLRARLRREARLAAQLAHPAVVRVFDLLETPDADWIVMELVEGSPLAELLKDGPLSVDEALAYGLQVSRGLAAAHRLGIVHRDLKTENVLVQPDGEVKILDFGLAKRSPRAGLSGPGSGADPHGSETQTLEAPVLEVPGTRGESSLSTPGSVMGTGRAMSPEQARGLEVGPRSDLFSFGVLLYECLAGVSPFLGETFQDTLIRVATHHPARLDELRPEVPENLAELVARLMSKAPEQRPADADHVVGLLESWIELRRSSASQAPPVPAGVDTGVETELATAFQEPTLSVEPLKAPVRSEGSTTKGQVRRAWPWVSGVLVLAWIIGAGRIDFSGSEKPEAESPEAGLKATSPLDLYEQGMELVRRGDQPGSVDRAQEIFQGLLEADGDSAAAHAGLARVYWEKARSPSASGDSVYIEQAVQVARDAVRLNPYLADARVSLGLAELLAGRREAARKELDTALELDPTHGDAHFGLARLAETGGRLDLAEDFYRQAIELRPEPMYSDHLGALLYQQGRYAEAERQFRSSLNLAPDNVNALRNLGGVQYALGQVDEAAATFQRALKVRPDATLLSNLGTLYFDRGLYSKAAELFAQALRTGGASHDFNFWLNLADAQRQIPGRKQDAADSYGQAIRLLDKDLETAPGHVGLRSRRILALARAGSCERAELGIEPFGPIEEQADLQSHFRVAIAEEICHRRDRALERLEAVLTSGLSRHQVDAELDLLRLRADPRFRLMTSRLEQPGSMRSDR